MQEMIGKVVLDLSYYPGEDYYCDGEVEDELLEIVKQHKAEEFAGIIEERKSWPILYHLSPLRANIVSWLPMKKGSKVLEIGSGCGAITGALAKNGAEVTCVDLSKKRSMINAYRNQEKENITIKVGNFRDIEPSLAQDFDYIYLIGVFEYAMAYIGGENPYGEFLNIVKKHLAPEGKIVIAIENQFGLKYFAGCREDHLGDYFSGLEDYPRGGVVRTFARNRLEKICKECHLSDYHFYYPYPDYKFMSTLYSDRRLPREGELTNNLRNFDRDRLLLFDETKVFDSILREEAFPLFSNSYLLLIGKEEEIIYSKFSNDRVEEYGIRTDILEDVSGARWVEKHAVSESAKTHIDNILKSGELLKKRYEGSGLTVCPVEKKSEGLKFSYLSGETLEEKLDKALLKEGGEEFCGLLKKYYELVSYHAEEAVADFDFIFPNLLIDEEGNWKLIDYEWTYEKQMNPKEIAIRALYCYFLGSGRKEKVEEKVGLKKACQIFGVESWEEEALREKETKFQMSVTGKHLSLSQMRDAIHNEVLPLTDAVMMYQNKVAKEKAQIYLDLGQGFSEADSFFTTPVLLEDGAYRVQVKVPEKAKQIRFDPVMEPCLVTMRSLSLAGQALPVEKFLNNGRNIGKETVVFADHDPNFLLSLPSGAEGKTLEITYEMVRISSSMAENINFKKRFWQ